MLDFSKVDKPNFWYSFFYGLIWPLHNLLYYRNFKVVGKENLPADDGYLIISNHQNSLNDALGILFACPKQTVCFIARGDIFKKEKIGKIMRFFRIMPAFRKRDDAGDVSLNHVIFKEAARIIKDGHAAVLFPEAMHQDNHYLGTFKKGFARVAFNTAEATNFEKKIWIVPMGNHYENFFHIMSRLQITIGEPFAIDDLYETYKEHPEKAMTLLCQRARACVEPLMLNIEDQDNYDNIDLILTMYRKEWLKNNGSQPYTFETHLKADRAIVAALNELRESNEGRYNTLMEDTAEYRRGLEKLGLRDWLFGRRFFLGFWLRVIAWIICTPLYLSSLIINLLPYEGTSLIHRKIKDKMFWGSINQVVLILFYPIWTLLLAGITWAVSGLWWAGLAMLVYVPLSLRIYYYTKIAAIKLYNRSRSFFYRISGNKLFQRTSHLRGGIINELDRIFLK